MINRKILISIFCVFGLLSMVISEIKAEGSSVPVIYDYDNKVETDNPDYAISIPAGIVFNIVDPGISVNIDIEMLTVIDGSPVPAGSKAEISVASKNGYVVSLNANGTDDPVEYQLVYEGVDLSGKQSQKIGTLEKNEDPGKDVLIIKGNGYILGAATKTGNHTDVLTYVVEDVTNK